MLTNFFIYDFHVPFMSSLLVITALYYLIELVDCSRPPNISNGEVTYNNTYYTFKAHYSCNLPYVLIGKPNIICQRNGLWGRPGRCGKFVILHTVILLRQ